MTKAVYCLLIIVAMISLNGCREHKTQDPSEVYQLWSGNNNLPSGVHLIHGYYWQSAHWSKEYIMYLELKAPLAWRNEFVKQNNLLLLEDTSLVPDPDIPEWFKVSKKFKLYVPKGFSEGSAYYEDTITGTMFIHEVQL
jgi:hypothetical protein